MKLRSIVQISILILAVLFSNSFNTEAKNDDCENMTDDQIVTAIYGYIQKKYPDHMNHVNVRSTDGVVTLEGWAAGNKKKANIEKFAKKLKCVKSVVNDLETKAGGGCSPGYKRCGTICIPNAETCNIKG